MTRFQTQQIRNVAVLGHGGSGKTSLTEALLHKSGATTRVGRVEDGTTVSDWDAEEQRRQISINLSIVPVDHGGHRINMIDTPGYQDFVGEVVSALHAAEAGLIVVDAVAGAEVGTELVWDRLNELGKPRIIFVNKIDRENANFQRTIESLREALPGSKIVPFQLPIGAESKFSGVVGLVDMKAYLGRESTQADLPADMVAAAEAAALELVEAAAETDDDLIMKYLDGEQLTPEEVRHGLHDGVKNGKITPVYVGSTGSEIGLERLLQAIWRYVPAPQERSVAATVAGAEKELSADPAGPVAATVFKTIIDRYVGRMSYVRVFSGTVAKDAQLAPARTGKPMRVANLFHVRGKELIPTEALVAGDVGVITKLEELQTGDTLTAADKIVSIASPEYPLPLYSVAIMPVSQGDSAKMGQSLSSLVEEDPTLSFETVSATHQTVLQGMGEAHVDVAVRRLESKFGVHVTTSVPKVSYMETVSRKASAQYRHKKQTGGSGQFAEVHMRVEPLPSGSGFQYASEVFGGVISHTFIPSIEKGVRQVLDLGVVAGYPVVDVKAIVYDGKEHPVDSKDIAFQTAGREAFKLAVQEAGPVLLEPIYNLDVTIPDEFMGDIMSDFTTRRGRVSGMEQKGNRTVVHATAPQSEIMRYGTDLRSMTQGRGVYSMAFSHYEPLPTHLAQTVIDAHKKEMAGEEH
jgi:elongation factor G